jgi:hypothetical protein
MHIVAEWLKPHPSVHRGLGSSCGIVAELAERPQVPHFSLTFWELEQELGVVTQQ